MKYELKAKKISFSCITYNPVYGLFDTKTLKKIKYPKDIKNCSYFFRHCIKITMPNGNWFSFYRYCKFEKLNKSDVIKAIIEYSKLRECHFITAGFDKESLDYFVNKFSK